MKTGVIIGIIMGVILISGAGVYFLISGFGNSSTEVFCPDYDNDETSCLSHAECEWDSAEGNCDLIGSVTDGKDNNEDEGDNALNAELEAISVPNNPSNEICKQIPLSNQPPYGERYYCLALVNHNAEFCEGIDEENSNLICLAHANEDSSYCKEIEELGAKKVCYYMLAVFSENADFCSDIDYDQNEKEQCYYNFISNLYQWDRSDEIKTEYCNQLGSPDDNTCLALKAKDVSMCGNNPNCLTHFEQPLSFCDTFSDYNSCIKDRAKTNKDISLCEMLSQPERDICIGVYCTHIELDVTICDTIEDPMQRQERYIELAMDLVNN